MGQGANTHSCVPISVVDAPRSDSRRAASLPRLNESSQTKFAGQERQKPLLWAIITGQNAHHWLRVQGKPFDFLQGFFGNVRRCKRDECLTTHAKVVVRDYIKHFTVRLEETA